MTSRIGWWIILSIGCSGECSISLVKRGEGGEGHYQARVTSEYTSSTEVLRSGWKLKHLKALTSPTGLGENLCQIEQEWTDRKTELEILVRCKVKAWVTFWCHWYPVSLNVWFIGKQNFGCYLKNSDNIRFLHSTVAESINRETNHFSDPLSSLSYSY